MLHAHDLAEYHCPDPRNFNSQMHLHRIRTVLELCRRADGVLRVLDLGCAQATTSLLLAEQGYRCVGVDLRPQFLAYAGLKHEHGVFFRCAANATSLPFADHSFDLVVWGEMIEHVAFPEQILGGIGRVLRAGGYLVLSTPNGMRLHTGLLTFSQVGNRGALIEKQFQPDGDGHLFLFSCDELRQLLAQSGFQMIEHGFYASPWVTGRLGFRHFMRWMPPAWRNGLDRWTLGLPVIRDRLAEGQILLAQKMTGYDNGTKELPVRGNSQ